MTRRGTLVATALLVLAGLGAGAQVRDQPRISSVAALGTLAGRVEIDIDRQRAPIRRARVTLTADPGGRQSTTTTDTDGRYRFERLATGTYRVRAEKPGFVPISLELPAPVLIKALDAVTFDIRMQRGAALEGRFLDDRGNAIKRLRVYADRLVGATEARAGANRYSATTDDLGRFRMHTLWPGMYYVHAKPLPPASAGELYFPNAPTSRQATVLTLVAGQTLDHLDFQVATAPLSPIAAEAMAAAEAPTPTGAATEMGARVTGRITRSDTGEPIANATVRMIPVRGSAAAVARSNAAGQYEFTGVSAGSYTLSAAADGYVSPDGSVVRPEGAGRTIEVKERERIENADLTVAAPGAIEGRVLDEFGEPAPGVSVQVTQLVYGAGGSMFAPSRSDTSTGPTDDRGWFRIYNLPPGNYYLLVPSAPLGTLAGGPAGTPALALADEISIGFATTFFPGTESVEAATPVRVAAGIDTRDVTFGLVAARMVTITGVAVTIAGEPAPKARMMLVQTYGGDLRTTVGTTTTADVNGAFRFSNVPEGTYVLQGYGTALSPSRTGLFGSLPVTAAASVPRTPLVVALTLRPLIAARGHLSFEGDAAPPRDPTSVSVHFRPTDMASGPIGSNANIAQLNRSGDFEIPNLAWKGLIRTMSPPGWVLKGVWLKGRDLTDTPYDFQSADVNGLEVVLTSRVGAVVGSALDAGRPAANATIVVFGRDESTWTYPSRFLAVTRPDAQGTFSLRGLLPGRYLAVAVPEQSMPRLDQEGLAALRPFAIPIEVSDGLETSLALTVIKR